MANFLSEFRTHHICLISAIIEMFTFCLVIIEMANFDVLLHQLITSSSTIEDCAACRVG